MRDPLAPYAQNGIDRAAALSGYVDYWVTPTVDDDDDNILDKDGAATVGTAIRSNEDCTIAYHDRHGNAHSDTLVANVPLITSIRRLLDAGTDDTSGSLVIKVAIAP